MASNGVKSLAEQIEAFNIIGNSPVLELVRREIVKVGQSGYNVLITGDTGVGKELIARNLHFNSPRRNKQFVDINCGGIPESLLEAELFGYSPGSFTGADTKGKSGKLEQANGGTLFLDEIGELSDKGQMSLLRAIQNKIITKIGDDKPLATDFRLIAATNVDLERAMRTGKFRQDLYFRLNEMRFHIPPLEERSEDISLLVEHFFQKYCLEQGKPRMNVDDSALQVLASYHWPGNVRELEILVKRCVVYCERTVITSRDINKLLGNIPSSGAGSKSVIKIDAETVQQVGKKAVDLGLSIEEVERGMIDAAIPRYGGDKIAAARGLGIGKSTLYRRLKEYEVRDQSSGDNGRVLRPAPSTPLRRDFTPVSKPTRPVTPPVSAEKPTYKDPEPSSFFGVKQVSQDFKSKSLAEIVSRLYCNGDAKREVPQVLTDLIIHDRELDLYLEPVVDGSQQKTLDIIISVQGSIKYLSTDLNGKIDDNKKAFSLGVLNSWLARTYKSAKMFKEGSDAAVLALQNLRYVEARVSDKSPIQLLMCRDYFFISELGRELGQNGVHDLEEGYKILWGLFESEKLFSGTDFDNLRIGLTYFSQKISESDVEARKQHLQKEKKLYESMLRSGVISQSFNPFEELEKVDKSLEGLVKKDDVNENLVSESSVVSQLTLWSQLDELMYFDNELDNLLRNARLSNQKENIADAVSFTSKAITYLEDLSGKVDESKRVLRISYVQSLLTLYYKDVDNQKALQNVSASIELLKLLGKETSENPAVRYFLAKQYFTQGNINYKLGFEQYEDLSEAEKILWQLFQERKLSAAQEFELLHNCLRNISRNELIDWNTKLKISEKRKELYSYMIENKINSNVFDPAQEIIVVKSFLSGLTNVKAYTSLDQLILSDSKIENLIGEGRGARKDNNLQDCIDSFEEAINYLQSLEGNVEEVKRQLRIGLIYQEIGRYYKEDGMLEEAIEVKQLAVRSLEFVATRIQDPSELQYELAQDYLTIANLKYKLRQDDTPEFKKAQKYFWPLLEQGKLTNPQDYASLNKILVFLVKRLEGEELIENLKQQLQFYQHIKSNRINVPNIHGIVDLEIANVQRILGKITSNASTDTKISQQI